MGVSGATVKAAPAPGAPATVQPAGAAQRPSFIIVLSLVVAVAFVYGQTTGYGFVNYDDPDYVYQNPHVTHGLTVESIGWAFSQTYALNWHPLTWLSHMLDWYVHGDWAGGHHFTNLWLHAANTVLLFIILRRMTGNAGPSAFTAAVFAVHPLHVESVAWVAERKDVLSGFFFMLTLLAYDSYVRRPSLRRYLATALAFAAGLMAKPMLVTVPFVLLLLDSWPLARFASSPRAARWLVIEKIPLLFLSAGSCIITMFAQSEAHSMFGQHVNCGLTQRLANAVSSYVIYIAQTICPLDLAAFYPHPAYALDPVPVWAMAGAGVLLLGISIWTVLWRKRHPYLAVGWFWFLGMLVPVIGLVQVGFQARADRYMYLPQIGLCIGAVWYLASAVSPARLRAAGAIVLVVYTALAWRQAGYWRDTEELPRAGSHQIHNLQ